ncbi:MAG TPA: hypothetical protein VGK24_04600 [Candidatus Angelobacter sp.]|jgi:hypothetical protein
MSEEKPLKFGHSSRAKRATRAFTSATFSQTTANRKYKTPSTQIRSNNDKREAPLDTFLHPGVNKTEVYEALHGLNAGIQQFINSLDFLDTSGLGLPFLNGYRILANEIRSAVNFSATEAMTAIELRDYNDLVKQRMTFSFPTMKNLKPKSRSVK